MNKKELSERDICTKFINPALEKSGWDLRKQVREEVSFTDGRIIVQGKLHIRGKRKRADYILYYKSNVPIAIIEANDNASGTTFKEVSGAVVKNFLFPLPPLEEQQTIVEKVNSLMALCDELEQQIETSHTQVEQLMHSCLKEVFETK